LKGDAGAVQLAHMVATNANPWYEKLKELYDREPFRPFVIRTNDGRSVRVAERQYILFAPTLKTIHVSTGGEKTAWIAANSVVDVKEAARSSNGKRHR
jgi:hypothetical protein